MKHVGFPPCLGPSGLGPCSSVVRTRPIAETRFTADEVGPARYWSEHADRPAAFEQADMD